VLAPAGITTTVFADAWARQRKKRDGKASSMTTVLDNTSNFAMRLGTCTLAINGLAGAAIFATAAVIGIAALRYPGS
jgi:hypothetical protein